MLTLPELNLMSKVTMQSQGPNNGTVLKWQSNFSLTVLKESKPLVWGVTPLSARSLPTDWIKNPFRICGIIWTRLRSLRLKSCTSRDCEIQIHRAGHTVVHFQLRELPRLCMSLFTAHEIETGCYVLLQRHSSVCYSEQVRSPCSSYW